MAKREEIKKVSDIANEGSKYDNLKATAKVANIQERFDDTTHNDNPYDDAIQYLQKKIEDVIDESNLQGTASGSYATDIKTLTLASGSFSARVTTNDAKTGISTAQRNAINANTAKVSSPFPAITTKQENATITIAGLQHTPAATDDAKDTLAISVQIVVGKTKTVKTFTLTAN